MKKTLSIILIAVLAISSVVGVTAAISKSTKNHTDETTSVVSTESSTTVETEKATTAPTVKATVKPTVKETVKPTTNKTKPTVKKPTVKPTVKPTTKPTVKPTTKPTVKPTTKPTTIPTTVPTTIPTTVPTIAPTTEPTESATTPETLVMSDVTGMWKHTKNEGCSIQVINQKDNKVDLIIESHNATATKIATAKVTVTLDIKKDSKGVYGTADFKFKDSFGNKGEGTITVREDSITLTLKSDSANVTGWNITNASGNYVKVNNKVIEPSEPSTQNTPEAPATSIIKD